MEASGREGLVAGGRGAAEERYSLVSWMRLESSSPRLRYSVLVGSLASASLIWSRFLVSGVQEDADAHWLHEPERVDTVERKCCQLRSRLLSDS